MEAFQSYVDQLEDLVFATAVRTPALKSKLAMEAALDGQPAAELRRLVPICERRSAGAFFTGTELARRALAPLGKSLLRKATVMDPSCGVGDLLIACTEHLPVGQGLRETVSLWGDRLTGCDIHPEFVRATKLRLVLAAIRRGVTCATGSLPVVEETFPGIQARCGLSDRAAVAKASCIVLNPPFGPVHAAPDCHWASGKVSSAAVFLEQCICQSRVGTRLIAILPDVLRSGSRYRKWRRLIEAQTRRRSIELVGRFDQWADVDVFILRAEISAAQDHAGPADWGRPRLTRKKCIGDFFKISVGPVVANRDPKRGPWHPFVFSRALPRWETVTDISHRRRFRGRTVAPPFVAVRRTSRPEDEHRAVGTIIKGSRSVAVENHLFVLTPHDRTLRTCRQLLRVLRSAKTSAWLNRRIRCRHLTVSALAEIPWRGTER